MVTGMKMTTIAVSAGVLGVVGIGTAAALPHHHVSPGCKIVSTTRMGPAYSNLNDSTGLVTVTTVEKCKGRLVTHVTYEIVRRHVAHPL
jgi:hypothetical protein